MPIEDHLYKIYDRLGELSAKVDSFIDNRKEDMEAYGKLEGRVDALEKFRYWAVGVIAGTSLICTAIWQVAEKFI